MNIKTVLLCALAILCAQASLTWGGPILSTTSIKPSDLNTPLSSPGTSYMYTYIGCASASNGVFVNCSYDFKITELTQPNADVANNGGHTHTYSAHPLGKLNVIWPISGAPSTSLRGDTQNNLVFFRHEIPQASGKIQTVMNLRVPPGWYTVSPESCDASRSYWCTNTTVDVGVKNLKPLLDVPSLYHKVRKPNPDVNHTDAVAFYGTPSALSNLSSIADWYDFLVLGNTILSINDMSLVQGGVFDLGLNYVAKPPPPSLNALTGHKEHRTGESADINKNNGDCTKNKILLFSVALVMGRNGGPVFANQTPPSYGHFICETGRRYNYSNNIHIDL